MSVVFSTTKKKDDKHDNDACTIKLAEKHTRRTHGRRNTGARVGSSPFRVYGNRELEQNIKSSASSGRFSGKDGLLCVCPHGAVEKNTRSEACRRHRRDDTAHGRDGKHVPRQMAESKEGGHRNAKTFGNRPPRPSSGNVSQSANPEKIPLPPSRIFKV